MVLAMATEKPARSSGHVAVRAPGRATANFNGLKVFSATMFADRDRLGERVTDWIASHPGFELTEIVVTQSSDDAFHCIAFTVFYWEPLAGAAKASG